MNKIIKLGLATMVWMTMSFSSSSNVFVCDSNTSVAYHASDSCKGLNKCSHKIISVTLSEATNKGKRACKICY